MDNKMVTIYDIAKKVGCASSTVSRALNGTRNVNPILKAQIVKTAKEMGYIANVTARNLNSSQSWSIGIIYHESLELGLEHQHFGAILQAFKTSVENEGYDITFVSRRTGNQVQTYLEWCKSRRIAGVLIVTVDHRDEQLVELIESDIPVVSVNKVDLECSTIISDNEVGTQLAMDHLFSNGLKRIAHISLPLSSFSGKERRETYQRIMSKHNFDHMITIANNYEYQDGYESAKKIVNDFSTIPEGIFVGSDMLAIGAIDALKDLGYAVPEDIEVIGFDNIELSKYVTPALTTINQNKHQIGVEAARVLISFISGINKKTNDLLVKVPVTLINRKSTK